MGSNAAGGALAGGPVASELSTSLLRDVSRWGALAGGRLEPRPRRASAERGFGALVGGSGLVKQGWEPTF